MSYVRKLWNQHYRYKSVREGGKVRSIYFGKAGATESDKPYTTQKDISPEIAKSLNTTSTNNIVEPTVNQERTNEGSDRMNEQDSITEINLANFEKNGKTAKIGIWISKIPTKLSSEHKYTLDWDGIRQRFSVSDFDVNNGVRGILFSKYSAIAEKLCNGRQSVLFSLPDDIIELIKRTNDEQNKKHSEDIKMWDEAGIQEFTIQNNDMGGYASFNAPKNIDITEHKWESGDPITFDQKTIDFFLAKGKEFKVQNEGEWPSFNISVREFLESEEGKKRQAIFHQVKKVEAEEQKSKTEQKENKTKVYEEQKSKAIEEAKKTGKDVIIRKIAMYDGDDEFPNEELGIVNVYEVATPDGRIIEKSVPSY